MRPGVVGEGGPLILGNQVFPQLHKYINCTLRGAVMFACGDQCDIMGGGAMHLEKLSLQLASSWLSRRLKLPS